MGFVHTASECTRAVARFSESRGPHRSHNDIAGRRRCTCAAETYDQLKPNGG